MSSTTLEGPYADLTKTSTTGEAQTQAKGVPFWGDGSDAWDSVWIKGNRLPGICEIDGKGFERRVDRKKSAGRNGAVLTHTGMDPADVDIRILMWTPEHLETFTKLIREIRPKKETVTTSKKTITVKDDQLAAYDTRGLGGTWMRTGGQAFQETGGLGGMGGLNIGKDRLSFGQWSNTLRSKTRTVTTTKKTGGIEPVEIYHPALELYGIKKVLIMSASLPERSGPDKFEVKIKCVEWVSGAQEKGVVETPKKAERKITSLGSVGGRRSQRPTPADDNTNP